MRTKKAIHRANLKKAKHDKKRKALKKAAKAQKNKGTNLLKLIYQTINNYFPDLFDDLREIKDSRKAPVYDISEIITASLALFFLKRVHETH